MRRLLQGPSSVFREERTAIIRAAWTHLGLADTQQIGRVAIYPKNPDIVFVAALGHLFTPNEERGLFRTKAGGKTWKKVLYV